MALFQNAEAQQVQKALAAKIKAKVEKGMADLKAAAADPHKTWPVIEAWSGKKVSEEALDIGPEDYRSHVRVEFRPQYFSYSNPPRVTGEIVVTVKWNYYLHGLPRQSRKFSVREHDELDIAKYYATAVKLVERSLEPLKRDDEAHEYRENKDALERKYKKRDFPERLDGLYVEFEEEKDGEPRWKVNFDHLYDLTTEQVRKLAAAIKEFHK